MFAQASVVSTFTTNFKVEKEDKIFIPWLEILNIVFQKITTKPPFYVFMKFGVCSSMDCIDNLRYLT